MQDFNPNTRIIEHFELPAPNWFYRTYGNLIVSAGKLRGLDLSHYQDDAKIDFLVLKDNKIDFVILKVTEGTGYVDPTFEPKYKAALDAGLFVLPYHFFRGNYGGASQAVFSIDTMDSVGFLTEINYTPILLHDVETSDGVTISTRQNRLLATLQTTESNGLQGGVYSSPYYWNMLIGNVSWISNYWQWVAHWTSASVPTLPLGWDWSRTIFWQNGIYPTHSWVEEVIGVSVSVDHDYFFGDLEKLKEILKVQVTLPPSECCDELKAVITQLQSDVNYLRESDEFIKERLTSIENGQTALFQVTDNLDSRIKTWETFEENLRKDLCEE